MNAKKPSTFSPSFFYFFKRTIKNGSFHSYPPCNGCRNWHRHYYRPCTWNPYQSRRYYFTCKYHNAPELYKPTYPLHLHCCSLDNTPISRIHTQHLSRRPGCEHCAQCFTRASLSPQRLWSHGIEIKHPWLLFWTHHGKYSCVSIN